MLYSLSVEAATLLALALAAAAPTVALAAPAVALAAVTLAVAVAALALAVLALALALALAATTLTAPSPPPAPLAAVVPVVSCLQRKVLRYHSALISVNENMNCPPPRRPFGCTKKGSRSNDGWYPRSPASHRASALTAEIHAPGGITPW